MQPRLNRREALGTIGAVGVAATLAARATPTQAHEVKKVQHIHRGVVGKMTGAQAAVAALQCEGVPCVFGIPGAQNNEFWDAMKSAGLPYLLVTHEASASVMADAAARVCGNVGVCSVVPGPGLTNALTGLGEALLDSSPVVALVTDVNRAPDAPAFQVHSLANSAILRPITKAVIELQHQGQIPAAIHEAFRIARAGEPGPVGVVIPFTLYNQTWDYNEPVPYPLPWPFDEAAYRRALGLLSDKKNRVGIYAGMGCHDVGPPLAQLAEVLQAPVATSVSGKGAIPDAHPLAVGWGYGKQGTRAAEQAFKEVDVVLAVGVKFSEVSTASYALPEKKVIHVDANPQNLTRNVHTCVAVNADSRLLVNRLLQDASCIQRQPNPHLWKRISKSRAQDRQENATPRITQGVDPMLFMTQIRCILSPEELIFVDVTASTHWASEAIDVPGPRRYFTPANNQSMGWAIPAAIAGQRVRPDRFVACITGDGCFLMSAIEMSTAAREGLPVKFFVFDDGAYHYMQMLQEPTFRRTTATELAAINYGAFAAAMGLSYVEIPHNDFIAGGITQALSIQGPVLTRVAISYEGRDIRWLKAAKSAYIDHLSSEQKRRMALRLVGRTLNRRPEND